MLYCYFSGHFALLASAGLIRDISRLYLRLSNIDYLFLLFSYFQLLLLSDALYFFIDYWLCFHWAMTLFSLIFYWCFVFFLSDFHLIFIFDALPDLLSFTISLPSRFDIDWIYFIEPAYAAPLFDAFATLMLLFFFLRCCVTLLMPLLDAIIVSISPPSFSFSFISLRSSLGFLSFIYISLSWYICIVLFYQYDVFAPYIYFSMLLSLRPPLPIAIAFAIFRQRAISSELMLSAVRHISLYATAISFRHAFAALIYLIYIRLPSWLPGHTGIHISFHFTPDLSCSSHTLYFAAILIFRHAWYDYYTFLRLLRAAVISTLSSLMPYIFTLLRHFIDVDYALRHAIFIPLATITYAIIIRDGWLHSPHAVADAMLCAIYSSPPTFRLIFIYWFICRRDAYSPVRFFMMLSPDADCRCPFWCSSCFACRFSLTL